MMIAVNTKSGIQDIRSLLVFLWPAGHSFADGIVVPAAYQRNDAPSRQEGRRRCFTATFPPNRGCALDVVSMPGVGGDRVEREL